MEVNSAVDILALSAMKEITRAAEDYFDEQLDVLGLQKNNQHRKKRLCDFHMYLDLSFDVHISLSMQLV